MVSMNVRPFVTLSGTTKREQAKDAILQVLGGWCAEDAEWSGDRPWFVQTTWSADHRSNRYGIKSSDLHDVVSMAEHRVFSSCVSDYVADEVLFPRYGEPVLTVPHYSEKGERCRMFATVYMPSLNVSASVVRAALKELLAEGKVIDSSPWRKTRKVIVLATEADAAQETFKQEEARAASEVIEALGVLDDARHSPSTKYTPSQVVVSVAELQRLLARLNDTKEV